MSIELRREYVKRLKTRYQKATKKQKTKMLDEFCEVTEYSRKYAIKILNDTVDPFKKRRPGRTAKYNAAIVWHLRRIWEGMDRCGSRTLVGNLPDWMPDYYAEGLTEAIRMLLLAMSPATVDRLLRAYRQAHRRGISTTQGSRNLLKGKIPLKVLGQKPDKPGYLEADTVAHCGPTAIGRFGNSLTMTDLFTGWTENRACLGKTEDEVLELIKQIEFSMPFELRGISCDNGSEFLNYSVLEHLHERTNPVEFVRTRAYKKNDNPHVEQKNWTHVRQVFGYDRIDDPRLIPLMNQIYTELWNPYRNFFFVCRKLIKKERVGAKIRKKYDTPKTPYQRLLESSDISDKIKIILKKQRTQLNPFKLKRDLDKALSQFQKLLNQINHKRSAS